MNALAHELLSTLSTSGNLRAFLRVIREGETSQTDDAYRTQVYGRQLDDLADHPREVITGTIGGREIRSSAAGAYQFLRGTWDECAAALGLSDFGPVSQDIAAVYLIRRRGALDDVLAGRVREAIAKCNKEWASLPGSPYGQPTKTLTRALDVYRHWGGVERPDDQPAPIESRHVPKENRMPIPAVLTGLASILVNAFSPLVAEKLTKEMRRHTGDTKVAEQISGTIIEAAKAVTGQTEPLQAVAAVQADPALVQRVEADVMARMTAIAPMLERLAELDEAQYRRDEGSRDAAAARARTEAKDLDEYLTRSLLRLFVGVLAGGGALTAFLVWQGHSVEMILGALLGLVGLVGGKFSQRYDYRYGSSSGSAAKEITIAEMTRHK
jgi:muramidase (phage lysozyme)